jgi:hypothetical protein
MNHAQLEEGAKNCLGVVWKRWKPTGRPPYWKSYQRLGNRRPFSTIELFLLFLASKALKANAASRQWLSKKATFSLRSATDRGALLVSAILSPVYLGAQRRERVAFDLPRRTVRERERKLEMASAKIVHPELAELKLMPRKG